MQLQVASPFSDEDGSNRMSAGEDVESFISRVKTAATRLQEEGHKLDDLYIGFQLIRCFPQEFSTVQKSTDGKKRTSGSRAVFSFQLMKQDLEKAENAYLSSFTSKKSKTLPGATAAAHGDPNYKNDYKRKVSKDSLTSRLVSKTSMETPSTSEKPGFR
ncbi:retrovirus-related Pol polyprotein from transposon TNT 1-94 [Trichonephila clavipes]|nr:retrovirus-related Pol polyprotein from transposon TNT 1-94 [Trichonephila clavipes]